MTGGAVGEGKSQTAISKQQVYDIKFNRGVIMEDFERDRIVDVRGNATAMSISVSTQEVETRDIEFRIRDGRVQPGFTETDNEAYSGKRVQATAVSIEDSRAALVGHSDRQGTSRVRTRLGGRNREKGAVSKGQGFPQTFTRPTIRGGLEL